MPDVDRSCRQNERRHADERDDRRGTPNHFAVAIKFESEEHSVILLCKFPIDQCKAYATLVSGQREADHTGEIVGNSEADRGS